MKRILVWDAPNMDMQLSELLGRMPTSAERPDMHVLLKWFVDRSPEDDLKACVFVNIEHKQGGNPRFHGWLRMLSSVGFTVFAKPKSTPESDVDQDMIDFITSQREDLTEVVICSHDAKCFTNIANDLAQQNINVVLIGFSELMNGWIIQKFVFHDLESIPRVFSQELPRHINIWRIPDAGTYFEPTFKPSSRPIGPRRTPKRVKPLQTLQAQAVQPPVEELANVVTQV